MKIKNRIEFQNKSPVLSFAETDKVIDAVRSMSEKNYGASVVVDHDNKPIGIVTERDLM
ncbi:MAG: CBS domain-containing protein, partial [Alphaproteobacteria bacterium]